MIYELTPNMPEVRLRPLMQRFAEVMQQSSAIQRLLAVPSKKGFPEVVTP